MNTKNLLLTIFFVLSISGVATAGTGICQANASNPNFAGLCKMFDQSGCTLNQRTCDWIQLTSTGVCHANAENPNFDALCKQFNSDGCQLNARTCDWIEID